MRAAVPPDPQDRYRATGGVSGTDSADYPFYESKSPIRLPAGLAPNMAQMVLAELPLGGLKGHDFNSKDQMWSVNFAPVSGADVPRLPTAGGLPRAVDRAGRKRSPRLIIRPCVRASVRATGT